MSDYPTPRNYATLTQDPSSSVSTKALLYGGQETGLGVMGVQQSLDAEVDALDVETGDWERLRTEGSIPPKRFAHAAILRQSQSGDLSMVVFGGVVSGGLSNELYSLTGSTNDTPSIEGRPVRPNLCSTPCC